MAFSLLASRYDDPTYAGADIAESFSSLADVGIRWSLPGGIQRVELTVKAHSRYDAYERYVRHQGHRIALYDNLCSSYIGSQIYEVIPDGRHVTYVCAGPWKRTFDRQYDVSDMGDLTIPTDDINVVIKDILDDKVDVDSGDTTNVSDSGVNIGAWSPEMRGAYLLAGEAINELYKVGDSSNSPTDFYFVDQSFDGAQMQAPHAYLKSRLATADPDWIFNSSDLAPNGLTMARHIWDLRRQIIIGFGRLTGTDTGGGNAAFLTDAGGVDFRTYVTIGDTVLNYTQDELFRVSAVAQTVLTFQTPDHAGDWDNGDRYVVFLRDPSYTTWATSTETDLWDPRHREIHNEFDQTQAEAYRDAMLALYEKPQQQQAFVIGAPTIRDGNGVRWPLWRVFMGTSFYFRADDLFPEAALIGDSDNRETTFMAVAMDYTHSSGLLRVVPTTGDSRLDAMLGEAGIISGQIISTANAIRARKREGDG